MIEKLKILFGGWFQDEQANWDQDGSNLRPATVWDRRTELELLRRRIREQREINARRR